MSVPKPLVTPRRLVGCCCLGPIALVVAAAIGAAIWVFVRYRSYVVVARTLPHEMRAARLEGLPQTADDLRRSPPVAPEDNAAPLYEELRARFRAMDDSQRTREKRVTGAVLGHAPTSAERPAAAKLVADRADVLRLAEVIGRKPDCDLGRNYGSGEPILYSVELAANRLARILATKAVVESGAGRLREAFRTIEAGARIGEHMGRDPMLLPCLTHQSIVSVLDRAFGLVLLRHQADPDVLPIARRAAAALASRPRWLEALRGEAFSCRMIVREMRRDPRHIHPPPSGPAYVLVLLGAHRIVLDCMKARSIAYWRKVFRALRAHDGDLMAQYGVTRAIQEATEARAESATYEFSAILQPAFAEAAIRRAMVSEAACALRAALIEVVAHRRRRGAYPAALSDLDSAPPSDPFTGRPLPYKRTKDGFVLYSVGPNMRDDGGAPGPADAPEPLDMVVQYPDPMPRR